MKIEPLLLSTEAAAEILGLSRRTIQQLQARGELRPIRVGRAVRFHVEDLRNWVDGKRTEAGAMAR